MCYDFILKINVLNKSLFISSWVDKIFFVFFSKYQLVTCFIFEVLQFKMKINEKLCVICY
jgi:hypothetical protein